LANRPKSFVKVEGLPGDCSVSDIINLFYKYDRGLRIVGIEKEEGGKRGTGVAVVKFSKASAMGDAIKGRNGYEFDGVPLKVSFLETPPQTKDEHAAEYDKALAAAHESRR